MRSLATIPIQTRNSPPAVVPTGSRARLRYMRTLRHSRPPAALAASRAHLARAVGPVRAVEPQLDQAPSFTRDDLLTANDVAEVLQIKRSTALDYMRRGVIPACKIGRRWYALRSRLDAHIGDLFDGDAYCRR